MNGLTNTSHLLFVFERVHASVNILVRMCAWLWFVFERICILYNNWTHTRGQHSTEFVPFSFFFHFHFRTNTEKSLQNKKRVIKMLFVVVLEFFCCWTPLYVINTITLFNSDIVYKTLGYTTISYFQLLAYTSSCCNPITYCFMNRGFRKACLNLFRCCRHFHDNRRYSIGGGPLGATQSSEVT